MTYDVVIIGAGMAGLVAAAKAASMGKRVLILSRGQGTLPLSSGCIDLWGYTLDKPRQVTLNPYNEIKKVILRNPMHPYAYVFDQINESIEFLQKVLSSCGYSLVGSIEKNQMVITALGTLRPSALVPKSMIIRNSERVERVILVGFNGYLDFYPHLLLDNLQRLSPQFFPQAKMEVKILQWGNNSTGEVLRTNFLANLFNQERFLDFFVQELKPYSLTSTLFILPPILGEQPNYQILDALTTQLNSQVIETPGLPPSLPGYRIEQGFLSFIKIHHGELRIQNQVIGFRYKNGKVTTLIARDSSGKVQEIYGKSFVLATGSFWGGGLHFENNCIFEPIFNLPVKNVNERQNLFLSSKGHPLLKSGVEVDVNLRPNPWMNLYVAGSILAHSDYTSEKNGMGVALATGYKAGGLAAENKT
jgi:glycerol-3-phosphate dehydrogenase subunit B